MADDDSQILTMSAAITAESACATDYMSVELVFLGGFDITNPDINPPCRDVNPVALLWLQEDNPL